MSETTLTRREFLKASAGVAAAAAASSPGCAWLLPVPRPAPVGTFVNDVHSQLNRTRVRRLVRPSSMEALQQAVRRAAAEECAVSVSGARHAMGGQQFGTDTVLLDLRGMDRVLTFDAGAGEVEVEAGAGWPALIRSLIDVQRGQPRQWSILQKQSGADLLTIGGALACNAHSRALRMKPIISDVQAFTLVDADGNLHRVSRREAPELFRLAIGGYGLFGVIGSVRLRLGPRRKLERIVEVLDVEELMPAFERRIDDGFLYGDFQYAIDRSSEEFLRTGVFSCYRPLPDDAKMPPRMVELSAEEWRELISLAHAEPGRAFARYRAHYLATSGQRYWSDLHQLGTYVDRYHEEVDRRLQAAAPSSEIITEVYVPRETLSPFLRDVRADFRAHEVPLIYGTIRLIERDDESFLAWAKASYACVIFNLHTVHTPSGIERSAQDFRRLIDLAIRYDGSYYLTYHRFATREQVVRCYPQFPAWLRLKRRYDPEERFQSDWYRHYQAMFADII